MALSSDGFVFRPPRTAPSNATTTDEAVNGVDRDFKPVSDQNIIPAPDLVEQAADQYRAAVLGGADVQTEYVVWAANTANLSDLGNFTENDASGSIPDGTLPIVIQDNPLAVPNDGTNRVVIVDDANRSIDTVSSLVVRRGDTGEEFQLVGTGTFSTVSGVFTITDEQTLVDLGGGLSNIRGDSVRSIEYTVNAPTFWWSRNDQYENRVLWNGRRQRWEPIKGTPPRDLDVLLDGESYTLSPAPSQVAVGDFLPGDSADPDSYCMVRLGSIPNSASIPVAEPVAASGFGGIKVITDEELEDFSFSGDPTLAGVVGQASGSLLWNPDFVAEYAGQTIFYSYQGFVDQTDIEPVGDLLNANLEGRFIAPIPGPTDYPFIRIGSRQPLEAFMFNTDAQLAAQIFDEGQVGVSLATGRLKFSEADEDKADPTSPSFDRNYLGSQIFYDGVSLTKVPVPLRGAVRLVNSGGQPQTVAGKDVSLYVPDAVPLPSLGISGVVFNPDGTGTIPNTDTDPGIRPGNGSGLVRDIRGDWDLVIFGQNGQSTHVYTFDDDDEIPKFRFRIPRGTVWVDLREGSGGSEVILGKEDLSRFDGEQLWFLQAAVQPAVYMEEARIVSKIRNEFTLVGTEILVFAVDGEVYTWDASTDPGGVATSEGGTFTSSQIATSLNGAITGPGEVVEQLGRVIIQTTTVTNDKHFGRVEIGWGPDGTKDLSGPGALGFLPGWNIQVSDPVEPTDLHWLPDNGTHVGVYRSPFNLNGSKDNVSDLNHIARFEDVVLTSSVTQSPIILLDKIPLEDVAGYDEGVFFQLKDGLSIQNLDNWDEVFYEFGLEKFSWTETHREFSAVNQPTNNLFLGRTQIVEDSFLLPENGLRLSERGEPFQELTLNQDFLLPDGGDSGTALLIINVGPRVALGGRGQFAEGGTTFTDPSGDIDFVALGVKKGYQLKITQGDAEGTYIVAADATMTNSLEVEQQFPVAGSTVPWELYEGIDRDEFDLGVVADAQYVQFNHLPEDPWKIRVLSTLGLLPADQNAQASSRLQAVVGDALANGRQISTRFGLDADSPTASLVALTQMNLGEIVNSALSVPDPSSERFANGNFSIRVGDKTYTFDNGDLVKVAGALTFPLVGDLIEVQEVSGLLNFGTDVFAQFDGQDAIYVEEFLTPLSSPTELPQGTAEFDPDTGDLNFSQDDMVAYGGIETYFVEVMVAQGGTDVTLNPIQGSFLFTKPLREFQIVETQYFRAVEGSGELLEEPVDPDDPDSPIEPVEVTEQLPLFVRLEVATAGGAGDEVQQWNFNPTDRTVREDIEVDIYVGSTLYNVGSSPTATVDFNTNTILLDIGVPDTSVVRITYAVIEAFGGEQTYTASEPPVYRPPFRIAPDRTSFTLETDRTDEVVPGKLLRVAQFPFYITASTYDADTDTTTVDFIPGTQLEAGSLNPGSDSLSVLTDIPLAKTYNAEAPDGFWIDVTAPYEPINRGHQDIIFTGNLTAFAVTGHLLELGGFPFIISGSEQIDDGTRTKVEITSFFPQGFAFGQDEVRISARPVYPPLPSLFIGRGGVVVEEGFELILFGETDADGNVLPGRTLRPSIDYNLNADDGAIEFLDPPQGPLQPTQSLYLRHVQQRIIAPVLSEGVVLLPRFDARFVYIEAPSEENNKLGKVLQATYTFSNPDTWFYRTIPLLDYLGEVALEVAQEIAAQLPSLGPSPAVVPPIENANQGRLGLRAQLRDLGDQDRAARVFLEFYNDTIVAFEQIQETISGNIIGDRDGKFRFFIGRDKELPPPGYEDAISGDLNPRNIFSELFFAYNPSVTFLTRDPLVSPFDFTVEGDQLEGQYIDPDFLSDLIGQQRPFIMNDVDDVVLIGRTRKKLRLFPLRLEAFGRYRQLARPSRFSRLFPELADVFTLTDPGIGADLEEEPINRGVYAFRKRVQRLSFKGEGGTFKIQLPKRASTFFKSIGDIGNPVLGQIENIASIRMRLRLPRARIFAYSEEGFPEFDTLINLAGGVPFSTTPRPAVICTVLPLNQFPVGEGGLPDINQLAAQGGEIPDLTTGDPDLFTPPWIGDLSVTNQQKIAFGHPNGDIIDVTSPTAFELPIFPNTTVKRSIYIEDVFLGCIVTFRDDDPAGPNSILPGELLEVAADPDAADPPIELEQGDTIFVTFSDQDPELTTGNTPSDPPTNEERDLYSTGLPGFRENFDLRVDKADGEYVDITFPSFDDPSILGLKEILGQQPPLPLSTLEAVATFRNGRTEPAPIPALTGGFTNDSGDYSLPYLVAPNTEIDRLGEAQNQFTNFFEDTAIPSAVYPDEVLGDDGTILGAADGSNPPAVLITEQDVLPVTTAGAYTPNSGLGDVQEFDFLFVEKNQSFKGLPDGSQGILSVGRVTTGSSFVEPPRFVTPTLLGDRIRYNFKSAMTFVNRGVAQIPPGMLVRRVGSVTQFDITQISTGLLVFNDGTPAVVAGGLNNLFSLGTDNLITINLFTAPTPINPVPVFLQSVTIDFGAGGATGDAGFSAFGGGGVTANDNIIFVDTAAPFVTIAPNPGLVPPVLPEDPLNPGDTIPLWFTIDIDLTVGGIPGTGTSTTGFIRTDRLTLDEAIDFRTVIDRNEPAVGGFPVASELRVDYITSGTTDANTVNAPGSVNAGAAFTFLKPDTLGSTIGTFDPAPAGTGRGTVRVMAWEGGANAPIVTTEGVTFSAAASNTDIPADQGAGAILRGGGNAGTTSLEDFRVTQVDPFTGSLTNVEPGDICIIEGDGNVAGRGSTKVGTYLVKHTIDPNAGSFLLGTQVREVQMVSRLFPYNTESGWAQVRFPRLVSATAGDNGRVTLDTVSLQAGVSAWDATGKIYFIGSLDTTDLTATLVADYTLVDLVQNQIVLNLASIQDLAGNPKNSADIDALAEGTLITGFSGFDILMDKAGEETFPRNTVGAPLDSAGGATVVGFTDITIFVPGGGTVAYPVASIITGGAPAAGQIRVEAATPIANTSFVNNENAYVYTDVPQWARFVPSDIGAVNPNAVEGFWPGDPQLSPNLTTIETTDAPRAAFGFSAQDGVFLEPSVPKQVLDLTGADVRVVDAGNSVPAADIGFRDGPTFNEAATERVTFQIRRIRRFHDIQTNVESVLSDLRFAYEIRRGTVQSFGEENIGPDATPYPFVVYSVGGTQLGEFNDTNVNINPGDSFRLFDDDGTLIEEVEIGGIEGPDRIWLKEPGFTKIDSGDVAGKSFEIYLRIVPVPHEQSNEQLLELITDQILLERTADLSAQEGGFVPGELAPTDPRQVQDTDSSINYAGLGIQEGDIVIIDPAGALTGPNGDLPATGQEFGARPFGDRSVPNRTTAEGSQEVPFQAGEPSELDDNRGFYRITTVESAGVFVTSETIFSNPQGGNFVTFGTEAEYAVYPTVSGSTAPFADPPGGPGLEAQTDLRPTSFAGQNGSAANSFLGNNFSIGPFSYKIIRPLALFSEEAVDLVLFMRERTLSWIEEFDVIFNGQKAGNYFVFQRDQHIADLGNPTIPDDGKGLMTNEFVDGIRGLVNISPFANATDCLSVLDRRFWVNDYRLDSEFPPFQANVVSYATLESNANNPNADVGDGRPVLPDYIDDVLDNNDQFRELRFAWLDFRVNLEDGTLVQLRRFIDELPKLRREELRQLRISGSISDAFNLNS